MQDKEADGVADPMKVVEMRDYSESPTDSENRG